MSANRSLDAESRALFEAAVADAIPLAIERIHHEPPPPLPIPRQRERDERAALDESLSDVDLLSLHLEGGDEATFLKPGMAPMVLKDLRRGRWVVQSHLDLHGMHRNEARQQVAIFLAECLARGHRCVRIVHGKGYGSPGRIPVLKRLVLGWLTQRQEVLAYCQARTVEGGAGAVLVLLQGKR
ncbi:MAG: Smr/MutS family protein [Rhodocyclaceae bacterium]|nr:Smr/MutS family protein [Rhodocyclaceae bacterium]MDP3032182.1 Smr/MutS family protein [Rhodocyclaceae bacterium]